MDGQPVGGSTERDELHGPLGEAVKRGKGSSVRVLVCGGRDYENADALGQFMDELALRIPITAVIEGDAGGVDRRAGEWALPNKIRLPW